MFINLKFFTTGFILLQLFSSTANAQLASCDPAVAYQSGVLGQFTEDQISYLQGYKKRIEGGGGSFSPEAARIFAPSYMHDCLRNRYTPMQKTVSDLVNKYQRDAYAVGAGKWVADWVIPKKIDELFSNTYEWVKPVVELTGATEQITKFIRPDDSIVNKAMTIAFAQATLEARKTGSSAGGMEILKWLIKERENPTSPMFSNISSDTKQLIFQEALKQLEVIALADPNAEKGAVWFDEKVSEWLGLGIKPTDAKLQDIKEKLISGNALTAEERARKVGLDKQVVEKMTEVRSAAEAAQKLLIEGQIVAKAALEASKAYSNEEIWNLAQSELEKSGVDSRDPVKIVAYANSEKSKNCANSPQDIRCLAFTALEKDANFRKSAKVFAENAAVVSKVSAVAANGLRLIGADPDSIRLVTAISETGKTAANIAGLVAAASGSLGPLGWVSVASEIFDLGGSLGGMFGEQGPDANAERHKQVMQALADISRQVEDLRKITLERFAKQDRQFAALTAYSQSNLAILSTLTENLGFRQCLNLADFATDTGITDSVLLKSALLSTDNTMASSIAYCATWLSKGVSVVDLQDDGRVNEFFSTRLDVLKSSINDTTTDGAANDALVGELSRLQVGHQSLIRLTLMGLPANRLTGPYAVGNVGATMLASSSVLQTVQAIQKLQENIRAPENLPQDLADLMNGLGKQVSGSVSRARLNSMTAKPLNAVVIAKVLQAALLIRGIAPFLARTGNEYLTPARIDEARALETFVASRPNDWMWEVAPLAYAAIAQEVMYRGDFAIPLIDELLSSPTLVTGCVPAPLQPDGATLCARFGRKWLDQLYSDALVVVRNFPEIRTNLALWRVWKELKVQTNNGILSKEDGSETSLGQSFRPEYGYAMSQPTARLLQRQLPNVNFIKLRPRVESKPYTHEFERDKSWFIPISGKCSGFQDPALNGRVICENGFCKGTQLLKDQYNDWKLVLDADFVMPSNPESNEFIAWESRLRDVCVVASLPPQEILERGQWLGRAQFYQTVPVARTYLNTLAHYLNLEKGLKAPREQSTLGGEALLMSILLRPPRVPLVRSVAK